MARRQGSAQPRDRYRIDGHVETEIGRQQRQAT